MDDKLILGIRLTSRLQPIDDFTDAGCPRGMFVFRYITIVEEAYQVIFLMDPFWTQIIQVCIRVLQ